MRAKVAKYQGLKEAPIKPGVVIATYAPPVDLAVRVTNYGECEVTVQLSDPKGATDFKTIGPPSVKWGRRAGEISGAAISKVSIACGLGQGECSFDYSIIAN